MVLLCSEGAIEGWPVPELQQGPLQLACLTQETKQNPLSTQSKMAEMDRNGLLMMVLVVFVATAVSVPERFGTITSDNIRTPQLKATTRQ